MRNHDQGIRQYWTPRIVVATLTHYADLVAQLESGMVTPTVMGGASIAWEPGPLIEKLVCRKADIDLAVKRLSHNPRRAVTLYYMEGLESYRAVGRAMQIDDRKAADTVRVGVARITIRLCNRQGAGPEAILELPDFESVPKTVRTPPPLRVHTEVHASGKRHEGGRGTVDFTA